MSRAGCWRMRVASRGKTLDSAQGVSAHSYRSGAPQPAQRRGASSSPTASERPSLCCRAASLRGRVSRTSSRRRAQVVATARQRRALASDPLARARAVPCASSQPLATMATHKAVRRAAIASQTVHRERHGRDRFERLALRFAKTVYRQAMPIQRSTSQPPAMPRTGTRRWCWVPSSSGARWA